MGTRVIIWFSMVSICDQIVHDGTPWETCDALRIRYAPQKRHSFMEWHFLWCRNRSQTADSQPLTVAVGGTEMSVSPVDCPTKSEANRKSAEQKSTGHGSAMRDYCEADRANAMSETRLRIRYAPPYRRNPNLIPIGNGFGFLCFFSEIVICQFLLDYVAGRDSGSDRICNLQIDLQVAYIYVSYSYLLTN